VERKKRGPLRQGNGSWEEKDQKGGLQKQKSLSHVLPRGGDQKGKYSLYVTTGTAHTPEIGEDKPKILLCGKRSRTFAGVGVKSGKTREGGNLFKTIRERGVWENGGNRKSNRDWGYCRLIQCHLEKLSSHHLERGMRGKGNNHS